MSKKLPKRLFRYRSGVFEDGRCLDIESLYKMEVWAVAAQNFNDPYDSATSLKHSGSEIEKEKIIKKFSELNQKYTYVACFSQKQNSLPMWSYYAKDHTGFCIEYDPYDFPEESYPIPVKYINSIPDYNKLGKTVIPFSLIKSKQWKHEKEWRIVQFADFNETQNYVKAMPILVNKPTAIYLGCRSRDDLISELSKYCLYSKVPLFNTELCKEKFDLKHTRIL